MQFLSYNTFQAVAALAEKHQMDGMAQPLSLAIMQTPRGVKASREEIFLRGRAVQLGQIISRTATATEAIIYLGEKLMEEGLADAI